MQFLAALLALTGFLWLAGYSQQAPASETGYTAAQRASLDALVIRELGYHSQKAITRSSGLLMRQASALQSLYGVTDDEIAKPVVLFK